MVDPTSYYPEVSGTRWELGYLGTYSDDRQPTVDELLVQPARRRSDEHFVVAGPQYPAHITWPGNVERIEHLPPPEHRAFYNAQHFTLNVTRASMIAAGYSPSVRLFEAAACGVPVISDRWTGIEDFFQPGAEILVADDTDDVERYLTEIGGEERAAVGRRARDRVLAEHTAETRAAELVEHLRSVAPALVKETP
jgi:spore maturation protein CgeB